MRSASRSHCLRIVNRRAPVPSRKRCSIFALPLPNWCTTTSWSRRTSSGKSGASGNTPLGAISGTGTLPRKSGKLDQLQREIGARKRGTLFPRTGKANGVTARDDLPCRVVGEIRVGLIGVIEVERLGRALAGLVEIAERRKLQRCQPFPQPPALAAVGRLNGPLRFPVAVLIVEHRILPLVNERARQARRQHGEWRRV